jgi:hypothetical protein
MYYRAVSSILTLMVVSYCDMQLPALHIVCDAQLNCRMLLQLLQRWGETTEHKIKINISCIKMKQ